MAGRRQHYLPRFLQRPFRYRASGQQDYVHCHETTRSFTPNTMGLGQERDFYGRSDQSSADDNITRGEDQLAQIVRQLNEEPDKVPAEDMALFIAALAVRTKKMREAMADLVKVMAQSMGDAFAKQAMWRQELDSYWDDKQKIEGLIDEEVAKHPGLNRETRSKARAFVRQQWMAQKRALYDAMSLRVRVLAGQFFEQMDAQSADIADRAFAKVFEDDPSVPKRVDHLMGYTFSVMEADGKEFILGDCAAVGVRSDGQPRLATGSFDQENPLDFIFLPISPERCVVASRLHGPTPFAINDINRFSAALSHQFFISRSARVEQLDTLRSLIGTAEPMASEEDVAKLMRSIAT